MSQLILHERIETTVPRAKELRKVADRMVTLGKEVRSSDTDCTAAPDKHLLSGLFLRLESLAKGLHATC